MPVAGRLIGKIGGRMLLLIGGVICAIGLVVLSMSSTLPLFYAGGTILGIGFGISIQFVPIVVVNRWFIARKGLVMGAVLAGSGVGGMILAFLIPQVIENSGWRTAYQVSAVVVLICTWVPALLLIRNQPEDVGLRALGAGERPADPNAVLPAETLPGLTLAEALKSPWLYVLYGVVFLLGAMHAMGQHIANYMAGVPKEISLAEISAAVMVISISLVIFKPLLGALIDKLGLMRALSLTLGLSAVITFGSAFITNTTLYVIAMAGLALGFANGTVSPPLVGAQTFGQREFPKIWGVLGTAYPVGSAVGAPLWGLTKDVFGSYGWGFVSVPVWTALVLVGFAISIKRGRALWADQQGVVDH